MGIGTDKKGLVKPSKLAKRIIKVLGFTNQEDILYKLIRGNVKYTNYGMLPTDSTGVYSTYSGEEVNYLELMDLARPFLKMNPNVLEIGCGFGYGAQLIYKDIKPNSLVSIDRAKNAIEFAQKTFGNKEVAYRYFDFSSNVVPKNSLDIIYTVESGGLFPMEKSFNQAYELLNENGFFLVANINTKDEIQKKRELAEKAGYELFSERDVTAQVIDYLKSDEGSQRFYKVLDSMPFYKASFFKLFMKPLKEFFRVPGSKSLELLGKEEYYYHFCFRKGSKS